MRRAALATALIVVLLSLVGAGARASPSPPGMTAADPTQILAAPPSTLVTGVATTLVATLRDAATNVPMSGGTLSFAEQTTFGWLPLGNVTTNVQGQGGVPFEPAYNGTYTVVVSFAGDAGHQPSNATLTLIVLSTASSPPPLIPPDRAIVLVIVAVVGGVWATYGFVAFLVLGIRSAGARPESESEEKENMEKESSEPEASLKSVPRIVNTNRAVVYLSVSALVLSGAAVALLVMGGVGHSTAYTPTTVELQVTVMADFRGAGWDSYVPDELVVHAGDTVKISAYNEDTGMAHGFAIDAFGVNTQLPAATQDAGGNITPSVTLITFTVTNAGAFTWYCTDPCGPGHLSMIGTLVVLPDD